MADQKIWLITGVSRGLGKEMAQVALAAGDIVIGSSRSGEADLKHESLHILPLEVTNPAQVKDFVKRAFALHGRFDVVVNNAGGGLMGAVEEVSAEEIKHVFDLNFFGPLELIREVLPVLRKQRSGHIINISSIAGVAPMAGYAMYAAAKFALEGMSMALAAEVKPLGIEVTLVEPGAFRTDFLTKESLQETGNRIADYDETSGKVLDVMKTMDGKQLGDPKKGAEAIKKAVDADEVPLHLLLGSDAVKRAREKFKSREDVLNRWESVSVSTDFKD